MTKRIGENLKNNPVPIDKENAEQEQTQEETQEELYVEKSRWHDFNEGKDKIKEKIEEEVDGMEEEDIIRGLYKRGYFDEQVKAIEKDAKHFEEDVDYTPEFNSGVRDIYQNCYKYINLCFLLLQSHYMLKHFFYQSHYLLYV